MTDASRIGDPAEGRSKVEIAPQSSSASPSESRELGFKGLIVRYWPMYGFVFLVGTENFIISPFLPEMAREFQGPVSTIAFAAAFYSLAYAFSAPFLGVASDRFGPSKLIGIGGLVFLSGNVLVSIAPSISFLEFSRGLTGIGGAIAGPAIWAYISIDVPATYRGQAIGLGMGAFSLGQVVGIPIGGLVAEVSSWRTAIAGIGIIMIPLVLYTLRSAIRNRNTAGTGGLGMSSILSVWKSLPIAQALSLNFIFQAANLGCYAFLGSILVARYGLSSGQVGAVGIFIGAGSLLGSVFGGRLNDRIRKQGFKGSQLQVLWAGVLVIGVLGSTSDVPLWVALLCILTWFAASGAFVTTQTALITLLAPFTRATVVSWNNSIMHAGAAAGVWLIGAGQTYGVTVASYGVLCGVIAILVAATMIPSETAFLKAQNA